MDEAPSKFQSVLDVWFSSDGWMELIDDVVAPLFFPHTNVRASSGTFLFPWPGCECVGRFATPTSRVHGKQIYGSSQVVGASPTAFKEFPRRLGRKD